MTRLTDAITETPSPHVSVHRQGIAESVLALIQSDECRWTIADFECVLDGDDGWCAADDIEGSAHLMHPECAQAALVAYLSADALTKETP